MEKLSALLEVLRKGSAVSDPQVWKTRGGIVAGVSVFVMALAQVAKAFGYDVHMDPDTASAIAGVIAFGVGLLTHTATNESVGLPAKREPDPPVSDDLRGGP